MGAHDAPQRPSTQRAAAGTLALCLRITRRPRSSIKLKKRRAALSAAAWQHDRRRHVVVVISAHMQAALTVPPTPAELY